MRITAGMWRNGSAPGSEPGGCWVRIPPSLPLPTGCRRLTKLTMDSDQSSPIVQMTAANECLRAENERLTKILNTPLIEEFVAAVKAEAAHQTWYWGPEHDARKTPDDWYGLIEYLSGKARQAHKDGNRRKALHHTISSSAALMHWHEAIQRQYPRSEKSR